MGIRGEIYSTKVSLQNRTYFFNVKENRLGDLYLNIVESKNKDSGGFDRQSVVLFADDLTDFLKGFDDSLRVLEKAAREKKRGMDTRDGLNRREREGGEERGGMAKVGHRREHGGFERGRGESNSPRKSGEKNFNRSGSGKLPFKGDGPKGPSHKGGPYQPGPSKGSGKSRVVRAVRRNDGPQTEGY